MEPSIDASSTRTVACSTTCREMRCTRSRLLGFERVALACASAPPPASADLFFALVIVSTAALGTPYAMATSRSK
eukprot:6689354-Prymnesium_polylepis.1